MALDLYSLCPSGNGKKIKFCKCQDSLSELDRVMTMLAGGQVVPALDRLNRMLEVHPDAACALAIKGRVLLDLREYEALGENAERFVRLQPNNPLALTQRAAAQLFRGKTSEGTESLLQALAESGREVDTFVLEVAAVLAFMLARQGMFLSARAFASLTLSAEGFEGAKTSAGILEELNTSPGISYLLKSLPPSLPRPERVEWAERYDEALGLLRSHRITLAHAKLTSLARTYPDEPAILSGLLTCAIWRADPEAETDCLMKLSRCQKLDRVQRSKYLAMAWLLEPNQDSIGIELMTLGSDIDNIVEAENALRSSPFFSEIPANTLRQLAAPDDQVPPRSGFQLLEEPLPEQGVALTGENIPETLGLVLLFGKQTDRAARIVVRMVMRRFLEVVRRTLSDTLSHVAWEEKLDHKLPFLQACDPRPAWGDRPEFRVDIEKALADFRTSRFGHRIATEPLAALKNRTLSDAAADPELALEREALVRLIESTDGIADEAAVLDEIRTAAGVSALPAIAVKTSDDLEMVENSDLGRVDCKTLDPEGLSFLLRRADLIDMDSVSERAAREILSRGESLSDTGLLVMAHMTLVKVSRNPVVMLERIETAKPVFDKLGFDQANLLLMELQARARVGDIAGFQNVIRKLTTDYRHREDVMVSLQQMLVAMGVINPDGSPRRGPAQGGQLAAEPAKGSGVIWTPDSGSPAAAPSPSGQAPSKLWIPGMD